MERLAPRGIFTLTHPHDRQTGSQGIKTHRRSRSNTLRVRVARIPLIAKEHPCPAEVKGTFLRPESSVEGSVLDSFSNVLRLDGGSTFEVCNGTRHF